MSVVDRLSPEQSQNVLRAVVDEGMVTEAQIRRAIDRQVSTMAKALEHLVAEVEGVTSPAIARPRRGRPPLSQGQARSVRSAAPGAKKGRGGITAEQRASRVLQGRYLGLIRQVPKTKRVSFQVVAKEQGREKAITALHRFLKSGTLPSMKVPKRNRVKTASKAKVKAKTRTRTRSRTATAKTAKPKSSKRPVSLLPRTPKKAPKIAETVTPPIPDDDELQEEMYSE